MPKKLIKKPVKRGPKPDTLLIKGDWKEAVRKSFKKKPPVGGWPNPKSSSQS